LLEIASLTPSCGTPVLPELIERNKIESAKSKATLKLACAQQNEPRSIPKKVDRGFVTSNAIDEVGLDWLAVTMRCASRSNTATLTSGAIFECNNVVRSHSNTATSYPSVLFEIAPGNNAVRSRLVLRHLVIETFSRFLDRNNAVRSRFNTARSILSTSKRT